MHQSSDRRGWRVFQLSLAVALAPLLIGCATSPGTPPGDSQAPNIGGWQCRNDLEIRCADGACAQEAGDGFTPMSVSVDASGNLSVCAYSGCWQGIGRVVRDTSFLVVIGQDLEFSTAPGEASARQRLLVAIDETDSVGILKAGEFAHPLRCERQQEEP